MKRKAHSESHRPPTAGWLSASVVGGWVLHDLCIYLASGEPRLAAVIAPASLVAILLGGLIGTVGSRFPLLLLGAVLLCAGLSLGPVVFELQLTMAQRWLPRALFLLLVAGLVASPFQSTRAGALRAGLLAGIVACVLVALFHGQTQATSWVLVVACAAGVATGKLRALALRRSATLLCVLVPASWLALEVRSTLELRRPDLPPLESSGRPETAGPNLVLIVLDTVRADRLAPYGHERVTTPGLDAFVAKYCQRYTEARSTSSWTLPSHASLLTGKLPDEHGATRPRGTNSEETVTLQAWPGQRLRSDVPTLAGILREAGYETSAILGNISFLRHEFGLDRGFGHYDDRTSAWMPDYLALVQLASLYPRIGFLPYREGRVVTDLALRWLDQRPAHVPFFLLLNYMEAHAPYIPVAPFERAFGDQRPRHPRSPETELRPLLYDRELASLDAQVTRVLDSLEQRGLLDDTVVIITSDHGEAFGEHGFWHHGWNLYGEAINVPLYVKPRAPGQPGVRDGPTSGADVFRIALVELGMEAHLPPEPKVAPEAPKMIGQLYLTRYLQGHFLSASGKEVGLAQIAWLEGEVKFLVDVDGQVQAFDTASDPGEQHPLELSEQQKATALERARSWWEDHPALEGGDPMPLNSSELERLRGLGYVGDG